MACPIHFVHYEEGCKTCENEVRRLMEKATKIGLTFPFHLKWEQKLQLIMDYDLELTDEPIIY